MAVLRRHLTLTISDVERAIPFYAALFGVSPEKVRPGCANFSVAQPAINFTLNEGERGDSLGAFNLLLRAPRQDLGARSRRHGVGGPTRRLLHVSVPQETVYA